MEILNKDVIIDIFSQIYSAYHRASRFAIFMRRGKTYLKLRSKRSIRGGFQYTRIQRWPSSLNVPDILRRTINFGQTIEINRTRLGAPSGILSIRAVVWRTRYTGDSLRDRKSTSKIYLLSGVGRRRCRHEHDDESALLYRRTNKLTRTWYLYSSGYESLSSPLKIISISAQLDFEFSKN